MKTSRTSSAGSVGQSLPLQSTASPFRTGQILSGTVISQIAAGCFYVDFGRTSTAAYSNLRLRPGNRIRVRVAGTRGRVTLKLIGPDGQEEKAGLEEQLSALLSSLGLPATPELMEQAWTLARFGLRPDGAKLAALSPFLESKGCRTLQETELAVWLQKNDRLESGTFDALRALVALEPGSWAAYAPDLRRALEPLTQKTPGYAEADGLYADLAALPETDDAHEAATRTLDLALNALSMPGYRTVPERIESGMSALHARLETQKPSREGERFIEAARPLERGLEADRLMSDISASCGQGRIDTVPFYVGGRAGLAIVRSTGAAGQAGHRWMSLACGFLGGGAAVSAVANIVRDTADVHVMTGDSDMLALTRGFGPEIADALSRHGITRAELHFSNTESADGPDASAAPPSAFPATGRLDIVA